MCYLFFSGEGSAASVKGNRRDDFAPLGQSGGRGVLVDGDEGMASKGGGQICLNLYLLALGPHKTYVSLYSLTPIHEPTHRRLSKPKKPVLEFIPCLLTEGTFY